MSIRRAGSLTYAATLCVGKLGGSDTDAASTPDSLFAASKIVDWFRADLGYTLVSSEVSAWTGQKRGISITAAAAGNRCARTAANALFNNQPTIDTSEAGVNYLRVTGLGTPIWTATDKPYILIVARDVGYVSGTDCLISFINASATVDTRIDVSAVGTFRLRANRDAANSDRTVSVTTTNAALIRAGVDHDNGTTGLTLTHNATTSATSGTGLAVDANTTGMAVGATTAGANIGTHEVAEIVLLNDFPSAGESSAYAAYSLARYGVPP